MDPSLRPKFKHLRICFQNVLEDKQFDLEETLEKIQKLHNFEEKMDLTKLSKKLSKMTNNIHLLIIKQLITRINNGDVDFFTTFKHLDLFCQHIEEVDEENPFSLSHAFQKDVEKVLKQSKYTVNISEKKKSRQ